MSYIDWVNDELTLHMCTTCNLLVTRRCQPNNWTTWTKTRYCNHWFTWIKKAIVKVSYACKLQNVTIRTFVIFGDNIPFRQWSAIKTEVVVISAHQDFPQNSSSEAVMTATTLYFLLSVLYNDSMRLMVPRNTQVPWHPRTQIAITLQSNLNLVPKDSLGNIPYAG